MPRKTAFSRALAGAMAAAAAAFSTSPAAAQSKAWELSYNQEVRYFSWRGDRGYPAAGIISTAPGSGSQIYSPATLGLTGILSDVLKFELVGRGGYVTSKQTTPGATGSVSTFTDTVAASTWTYYGIPGIQPFLSLNVNLPTGTPVLLGTDTFGRMDPDLVDIATFGEGLNFGATFGTNIAVTENIVFSAGVGHTWRGDYYREMVAGLPGTVELRVSPANVTTVNAALGFRNGPLTVQLSAAYSHEGTTSFAGVPSFQLGDRYMVSSSTNYAWSEASVSSMVASWSYAQKNKNSIPPSPLLLEMFNSNSNVYRVRLEHAFIHGNWSAGPVGSWLWRDENAYVPAAGQFVPAKTRWSAGGNLRYTAGTNALLYVSAEHVWIEENARPFPAPTAVPDANYTGWALLGGASFRY